MTKKAIRKADERYPKSGVKMKSIRVRCICCKQDASKCGCDTDDMHPLGQCARCCPNAVCGTCGHCILSHSKPGQEHCSQCPDMFCRFVDVRMMRAAQLIF